MPLKNEIRSIDHVVIAETRGEGDNKTLVLRGHAAVFNRLSHNLGGFREKIAPGAFDKVMDNDVRAVFNHDINMVLGRSSAGTLRLSTDDEGLAYEIDLPNTSYARDLHESVKRGDIKENSFKFSVMRDSWAYDDETGGEIRTIEEVSRLMDVGPVAFPAYPDATIAQRSLEDWKQAHRATVEGSEKLRKMKFDLLRKQLD